MKKIPLALFTALIFSQATALELKSDAQKLGYTMGHEMGTVLKETEDKRIDLEAAQAGVQDALEGKNQLGAEETSKLLETFTEEQAKLWQEKAEKEAAEAQAGTAEKKDKDETQAEASKAEEAKAAEAKAEEAKN